MNFTDLRVRAEVSFVLDEGKAAGLTIDQLNLIAALKLGQITWFEFFEKWKAL